MAYGSEIEKLERRWIENPMGVSFAPLAEAYRRAGDQARALELLAAGLLNHPSYVPALIVQARCHVDTGADEPAEASFRAVIESDTHNLIALKGLADICSRASRPVEARGFLERLLEADPTHDEAREHLERITAELAAVPAGGLAAAEGPAAPAEEPAPEPDVTEWRQSGEVERPDSDPVPVPVGQGGDAPADRDMVEMATEPFPESLLDSERAPLDAATAAAAEPPEDTGIPAAVHDDLGVEKERGPFDDLDPAEWSGPSLSSLESLDEPFEEGLLLERPNSPELTDSDFETPPPALEVSDVWRPDPDDQPVSPLGESSASDPKASEPAPTDDATDQASEWVPDLDRWDAPAAPPRVESDFAQEEDSVSFAATEPEAVADADLVTAETDAMLHAEADVPAAAEAEAIFGADSDSPPPVETRPDQPSEELSTVLIDELGWGGWDSSSAGEEERRDGAAVDEEPVPSGEADPILEPASDDEMAAKDLGTSVGDEFAPEAQDVADQPIGLSLDELSQPREAGGEPEASSREGETPAVSGEELVEMVDGAESELPQDAPVEIEPELVITETMARLFERQGHRTMALAVYAQLLEQQPENETLRAAVNRLKAELSPPGVVGNDVAVEQVIVQGVAPDPEPTEPSSAPRVASLDAPPTSAGSAPVSLGAIFGPPRRTPARTGDDPADSGPSFDEFFSPESGGSSSRSSLSEDEELEQFSAWLRSLKR